MSWNNDTQVIMTKLNTNLNSLMTSKNYDSHNYNSQNCHKKS